MSKQKRNPPFSRAYVDKNPLLPLEPVAELTLGILIRKERFVHKRRRKHNEDQEVQKQVKGNEAFSISAVAFGFIGGSHRTDQQKHCCYNKDFTGF